MNNFLLFVATASFLCFGGGVEAQSISSSPSMKFSGRIQSLATVTMTGEEMESNFLVRRARLKFQGTTINPKFTYKLELGLSNRDHGSPIPQTKNSARMILDAVVQYQMGKNTQLWFGQTKLPGNRERVISSSKLQFVDRSLLNSKYNIDRDMGVQLHHKFELGGLKGKAVVSISQGEGRNITTGNYGGFDYTGRIELLPFGSFTGKGDYFGSDLKREENPKLALGLTYDYHDKASRQRGNTGSFLSETRTLSTIFADLMFKYQGLSIMAEYAVKSSDQTPVFIVEGSGLEYFYTGTGLNIQSGYLFDNNIELALRYTSINPEDVLGKDDISMYTLGVSKYLDGHKLKVQSDFSIINEGLGDPTLMGRLQFELAF
ncbi:MAG: FmdC precursor [Bacteroidetes bacterium]|nr:MAG: FmdC precursor [Bacteroidota bacterium]